MIKEKVVDLDETSNFGEDHFLSKASITSKFSIENERRRFMHIPDIKTEKLGPLLCSLTSIFISIYEWNLQIKL